MTRHRFFIPADHIDTANGLVRIADAGLVWQIQRVLRLEPGDEIVVLDGQGALYNCLLRAGDNNALTATIVDRHFATGEPSLQVTVALPLIKGDRFEWALQKLTELGVRAIIPTLARRSVVKTQGKEKRQRWQAIVREAAEQCERAAIPQVVSPVELADLLSGSAATTLPDAEVVVVCVERSQAPLLHDQLHTLKDTGRLPLRLLIVVGPEGGLSPEEVEHAQRHMVVSLGPRILRTETAAITATAQVMAVLEG